MIRIIKKEKDVDPPPSTPLFPTRTWKPGSVTTGGTKQVPPKRYYWAPSPVSAKPRKESDHICDENKDKPLDPFDIKYVAITCCPLSPILVDPVAPPFRPTPVFKKPYPIQLKKVHLATDCDGGAAATPFRLNPVFKPQSQPSCPTTDGTKNANNESKTTLASPLPRPLSPTLCETFDNLTTKPLLIPENKAPNKAQPQPTKQLCLSADLPKNTTNDSEDTLASPSICRPLFPSRSTNLADLEDNFATLIQIDSQIIPEKGAPIFCYICQRSYLTKATFDWHAKRHLKCKECGMHLRRMPHSSDSETLNNYCAVCATELGIPFSPEMVDLFRQNETVTLKERKKVEVVEVEDDDDDEDYDVEEDKQTRRPGRPRKLKLVCEKCGREFVQKASFQNHLLRCRKPPPLEHPNLVKKEDLYLCNEKNCNKVFVSRKALNVHMKKHEKKEEKRNWRCLICDKLFMSEKALKMHMTVHLPSGEFTCEVCKKQFGSITNLKNHQRMTVFCSRRLKKEKGN